jgi:hypothetical protein
VVDFVRFAKAVAILSILILDVFVVELFLRTWFVGQLWASASFVTSAAVLGAVAVVVIGSALAVRGVVILDVDAL